jgi:hypothetical protein
MLGQACEVLGDSPMATDPASTTYPRLYYLFGCDLRDDAWGTDLAYIWRPWMPRVRTRVMYFIKYRGPRLLEVWICCHEYSIMRPVSEFRALLNTGILLCIRNYVLALPVPSHVQTLFYRGNIILGVGMCLAIRSFYRLPGFTMLT